MKNDRYVYFLYSEEQYKEKNTILNKANKIFEPGTVVVNGARKKFTQLSNSSTLPRFIDTKIIAEGNLSQFTYTEPQNVKKRGD
jgi:hypothetical protein